MLIPRWGVESDSPVALETICLKSHRRSADQKWAPPHVCALVLSDGVAGSEKKARGGREEEAAGSRGSDGRRATEVSATRLKRMLGAATESAGILSGRRHVVDVARVCCFCVFQGRRGGESERAEQRAGLRQG